MLKYLAFALALTFTAPAFAVDPITYVKEGLFWLDKSRTYEMVFENRPICRSTNWTATRDAAGRHVVNYYCDHGELVVDWYNEDNDNVEKWGPVELVWEHVIFVIGANGTIYYGGGSYNIDYAKMAIENPYTVKGDVFIETLMEAWADTGLTDARVWHRVNKHAINRHEATFTSILTDADW